MYWAPYVVCLTLVNANTGGYTKKTTVYGISYCGYLVGNLMCVLSSAFRRSADDLQRPQDVPRQRGSQVPQRHHRLLGQLLCWYCCEFSVFVSTDHALTGSSSCATTSPLSPSTAPRRDTLRRIPRKLNSIPCLTNGTTKPTRRTSVSATSTSGWTHWQCCLKNRKRGGLMIPAQSRW